jgi:hypothetical protein
MTLADTWQAAASATRARFRTGRGWLESPQAAARWLARRSKTAQALTAGMPIRPGEGVLLLGQAQDGAPVAATAEAVYAPGRLESGRSWCRLGWEEVIRIRWDDQRCALALIGAGPSGMWRQELVLGRHSALVELARERVGATLLASTVVRDGDRVVAVVTARRLPGSGKVLWVTLLSQAGATENQAIRVRAAAAIAELRAQTGIPAQ